MFTEIAHLPKLLSISSSIVEIFLSIKNGKNFAQAKLLVVQKFYKIRK